MLYSSNSDTIHSKLEVGGIHMQYVTLLFLIFFICIVYRAHIWRIRKNHDKFVKNHNELSENTTYIIEYLNKHAEIQEGNMLDYLLLVLVILAAFFNK